MSSKSGPTTTTTQNTTLPPHIIAAQQALINNANNILGPFLQQPGYAVAGLQPDQLLASDLANIAGAASMENISNPIKAYDVFGMGNQWQNAGAVQAQQVAAQQGAAEKAAAAAALAAQLAPGEIHPFVNPYVDIALDPLLQKLKQQQAEVQSGIGADAAASHMFGGSREAVMRMLADRNYRENLSTTAGTMLVDAFNKAAQLASANTDRKQQTNLANAQMANAVNIANAQLGTQASLQNAGLGTQAAIANAQLGTQAALQNQQLQFQGAQNDAARFLQSLGLQSQMNSSAINDQLKVAQMLAGLGGQQQQTMQNAINVPFDALTRLLQATGSLSGGSSTTGTSTSTKPVDFASIGLGLLGLLSDREDKTDIKKLGKDPKTGVDMYAYRYKGDPKSYPKVVGPMAQDLEKVLPGITKMIGGHRVVAGA